MAFTIILTRIVEPLIKSQNTSSRHSGACQNLVKTITHSALASCVALPPASMQSWMLVSTSMTENVLNQKFPNYREQYPSLRFGMTEGVGMASSFQIIMPGILQSYDF